MDLLFLSVGLAKGGHDFLRGRRSLNIGQDLGKYEVDLGDPRGKERSELRGEACDGGGVRAAQTDEREL